MLQLGMWMRLVINLHQLANGSMRIPLGRGERLVPQQLLNGAKVGPVCKQVRGKSVAQRVRVQVPIDVDKSDVLLDDTAHRALRQPPACIVEKDRLRVWVRLVNVN